MAPHQDSVTEELVKPSAGYQPTPNKIESATNSTEPKTPWKTKKVDDAGDMVTKEGAFFKDSITESSQSRVDGNRFQRVKPSPVSGRSLAAEIQLPDARIQRATRHTKDNNIAGAAQTIA